MDFVFFGLRFPKIAAKETRSIIFQDYEGVPDGMYGLLDLHCNDKECDCRRVFICVQQVDPNTKSNQVAMISYGWEDLDFYRKWGRSLPEDMILEFKGPALDTMQPQTRYAPYFLDLFIEIIENDTDYVSRLRKHYAYFKKAIGMKLPSEYKKMIKLYDPCPCGSGKNLRFCCGKSRKFLK